MATKTICYPVVRGEVARFTRVDDCGRPLPGACSVIVTDAIETIVATAELEEGEEISEKNMAGKICIADKPCDALKWYTIEITLCKVFPALYSLVAGYRSTVAMDNTINGYAIGQNIDCSGGFALEVWGNIPGVGCGSEAQTGQWDYLLFPWVSAAILSGNIEVGNAARKPVLTGRTKIGHAWGTGPFNVDTNPTSGVPIKLFDPPTSDEHLVDEVVHLAPPTPDCACIPLDGANAPTVTAEKDETDVTGNTVELTKTTMVGPFSVDFGDGTAVVPWTAVATSLTHAYTPPVTCTTSARCQYTIKVFDPDDISKTKFIEVLIPFP
jgi:hypothetical protein